MGSLISVALNNLCGQLSTVPRMGYQYDLKLYCESPKEISEGGITGWFSNAQPPGSRLVQVVTIPADGGGDDADATYPQYLFVFEKQMD